MVAPAGEEGIQGRQVALEGLIDPSDLLQVRGLHQRQPLCLFARHLGLAGGGGAQVEDIRDQPPVGVASWTPEILLEANQGPQKGVAAAKILGAHLSERGSSGPSPGQAAESREPS